jgi:hypothetical protein
VALSVGESIEVPRDADEAVLEAKRVDVEQSLLQLERRAAAMLE